MFMKKYCKKIVTTYRNVAYISNTKKFFQKTIDNFKSFISKGGSTYEKLPKTPKIEACSKELDNFYVEFTHQWDSNKGKVKGRGRKKSSKSQEFYTSFRQKENSENAARNEVKENVAPVKNSQTSYELHPRKLVDAEKVRIVSKQNHGEKNEGLKSKSLSVIRGFRPSDLCSRSVRETRLNMIYEKLKELEMMEKGNADHKQDVEEVLHYYSRLTCPAYLDLVDKFFKEICTEFLGPQVSTPANILRPL